VLSSSARHQVFAEVPFATTNPRTSAQAPTASAHAFVDP